jgi:hypothetical protein
MTLYVLYSLSKIMFYFKMTIDVTSKVTDVYLKPLHVICLVK